MNTGKPTRAPISFSSRTMMAKLVGNHHQHNTTCSIQKKHDSSRAGGKMSPHYHDRKVDLKKLIENESSSSFPDELTAATALTSFGSFGDFTNTASSHCLLSTETIPNRLGSILKSHSSIRNPKVISPPCTRRTISFSAAPAQVFTIENKEKYFDDIFYDQESLADFRYQALMWEAGMVDENGTPKDILESANETNDKFRNIDELNGSLDFNELLLGDDSSKPAQNQNDSSLVQSEEDRLEKKNARSEIQDLEGRISMISFDRKWKSAAQGNFVCNLQDWNVSQQSERSIPCNNESQQSRRSEGETISKSAKVRMSLTSLSDIFSSTRSLDFSDHNGTDNGEGDKRARLVAKMKGLRESLRSIQNMQNIDSDDDSDDGGNYCDQEEEEGGVNKKIFDGIDTKNLERSLITKHNIYSPKPNRITATLQRLERVNDELSVPEI